MFKSFEYIVDRINRMFRIFQFHFLGENGIIFSQEGVYVHNLKPANSTNAVRIMRQRRFSVERERQK